MNTRHGHLTYCSNIHPGVSWEDHFSSLREYVPFIRRSLAPGKPFGLGLRLSNEASIELSKPEILTAFQNWLVANNVYVYIINGFPYGNFHHSTVKSQVFAPDWTTRDRLAYTRRLFSILSKLLPDGMHGGVSTPPLTYSHWWNSEEAKFAATENATNHILEILDDLIEIHQECGKMLHLDIEPEPDGMLSTISDFINWYEDILLPMGKDHLFKKHGMQESVAKTRIKEHIQLCYDVCHAAVGFEKPKDLISTLNSKGLKVGRIQISSALKIDFETEREEKLQALAKFDEPVYLHQVSSRHADGSLTRYYDLPEAFKCWDRTHTEWRVHFHVPLFIDSYGLLDSMQDEILDTLDTQKRTPFSSYLEVETYTWGVLPLNMQKPIDESIVRELHWVKENLD